MRLTPVWVLSILLCINSLNTLTITSQNPDNGGPIDDDSSVKSQKEKISLKISDLNDDVLYLIFQNWGFVDLLSLIQTNSTLSIMAYEILRKRNYEVTICNEYCVDEDEYRVKINNFDLILNTLKYVPIRNLHVDYYYMDVFQMQFNNGKYMQKYIQMNFLPKIAKCMLNFEKHTKFGEIYNYDIHFIIFGNCECNFWHSIQLQ